MALNILTKSFKFNFKSVKPLGVIRNGSSDPSWIPEDPKTHTGQVIKLVW